MFGSVSARLRQVGIAAVIVGALGVAAPAALAKPHTDAGTAELAGAPSSPSGLAVSSLSSPPVGAAAGGSYALGGTVANPGGSALSGTVTVRLLKYGEAPRTVGTVGVQVAAGSTSSYETTVVLPSDLPDGSYALAACTPTGGEGELSCATARRGVDIGSQAEGGPASTEQTGARRRPSTRRRGARSLHARRTHALQARRPRLPRDGQRRLHQRPHRRQPDLRRGRKRIPPRDQRRPRRSRHPVPEQFQPRLRAQRAGQLGRARPRHGSRRGDGERRPRAHFEFVQPTYPGRPERPGRSESGRPRGRAGAPKSAKRIRCRRRVRRITAKIRPSKKARRRPGTSARRTSWWSPPRSRSRTAKPSKSKSNTPAGLVSTPTATARPRAGSSPTNRQATAASSPPSRSAPRPGCRSTTTPRRSRPTTSTRRSPRAARRSPTAN